MCGIFGIALSPGHRLRRSEWDDAVRRLFLLSQSRGKEAAGLAVATPDRIVIHKDSVAATEMLKTKDYSAAAERAINGHFASETDAGADGHGTINGAANGVDGIAAIGHCRLVTNGLQGIDANNQPVWRDNAIIVHNGIVVNVDALWAKHSDIKPRAEVDTEVIAALIEKWRAGGMHVIDATKRAFAEIYGETSIAMLFRDLNAMLLATNTGSLFVVRRADGKALFFASEAHICRQLVSGPDAIAGFQQSTIEQVKAGRGLLIDLASLDGQPFSLSEPLAAPNVSPKLGMQRVIEDKAQRYADARKNMRRCTKCLLPETMPFISFDAAGVCNYCHSYQPWVRRPIGELEELLARYRSKDGSPDCIMAFSGGRDSSYGLHLLKTKFRMNPMCFSYDWGMVTDLARRNQARMCGKLGIEHIWVSADIKKKRANIRANVLAWLKKPDLGLIPLFMAGDKEALLHANRLMRETGINTMVFCTNHFEKTEFKTGFLGIRSDSATIHKPASLSLSAKATMLGRYGTRFLANPAYLNRSLFDTAKAFMSYYAIPQTYLSLFDHLPWDENEINEVLIGDYEWERAKDTKTTWRIGDGTAPFYNYIYHTVAGFTEFDTFRSAQIREGVLKRSEAMVLVDEENLPRWDSIREYTQLINIDFDEMVRIIDRIPKLYVN